MLNPLYQPLLDRLPYVMLAIVLAFCIYFNRSRLFTATLAFLVIYYLINVSLQVPLTDPHAFLMYTLASLFLPVTLFLLFLIPERGLRNRYGALVAAIIPLQFLIVYGALSVFPRSELLSAADKLFSIWPHAKYVLSVNGTACFIIVAGTGVWKLCKDDNEYTAALLTILGFGYVTFALFYLNNISIVMFSVAGASLIISLMRSSYEMVYRDELTGLLGRRALNERLKGLSGDYVIAMLDLDYFKKINDTHGHDVGDEVLKMVANHIAAIKGGGIPYRYGGEEFCVVFPGKTVTECRPFLEIVRSNVENYSLVLRNARSRRVAKEIAIERRGRRAKSRNGKSISVTISIGVAASSEYLVDPNKVLKAADAALYKAKEKGRNCLATSAR